MAYPNTCGRYGGECVGCKDCFPVELTACKLCGDEHREEQFKSGLCPTCRATAKAKLITCLSSMDVAELNFLDNDTEGDCLSEWLQKERERHVAWKRTA